MASSPRQLAVLVIEIEIFACSHMSLDDVCNTLDTCLQFDLWFHGSIKRSHRRPWPARMNREHRQALLSVICVDAMGQHVEGYLTRSV